ncbi:hypothetical protein [Streptomyces sp. NPDC058657]|uniref:hypothetical protein n=1 Tax=unclassified Streptomyces TaxID=2593676 RepID=UPI00365CEFD5
MRHTNTQTTTRTLTDLYRALDHQRPVTLTFLKEEKDDAGRRTGRLITTVRTLELYEVSTTAEGHIVIKGMDRDSEETRTVRVDRILTYTTHRMAYALTRPEPTTPAGHIVTIVRSTAQVIARELGRDYLPRTATTLAA